MRITSIILGVIALVVDTEARKSYLIKDMINSGQLKVSSPRVGADSANWCLFKDVNNQFCLGATMSVQAQMKPTTIYQGSASTTIRAHSLVQYDFLTTQSMNINTNFLLAKLYQNQVAFNFPEFVFGWRYQLFYWINDYAYCLNFGRFAGPTIAYTLQVTNNLEYCTKTVINCLDDWTLFLSEEEKFTGQCQLSSTSPFTVYTKTFYDSGTSGANPGTHYYFGSGDYIANYCWPGFSPWYSYFDKYQNEMVHAFYVSFNDIFGLFTALQAGVYHIHGKAAPEGADQDNKPIVRDWDQIYKQSQDHWHKSHFDWLQQNKN